MHQTKGFTLLEIMMVITVIGILSMVAIPSIDEYIKNQRIKAQMYDFLNALNIARSEAVKRKTTTTLCNSTNLTSCAGLSTNWTNGYIVFEDVDGDGLFDAGSDTTINTNAALTGNSSLKKNAASNMSLTRPMAVSLLVQYLPYVMNAVFRKAVKLPFSQLGGPY